MRKKKNDIFPHVSYICIGDSQPVRWDSLSQEKRVEFSEKMMKSVSDNLSRHVNAHPEELDSLIPGSLE